MRNDFRAAVVSVLTDKEPTVRRAGLHGVLHLGAFFGQMFGATEVLSHITQKHFVDSSFQLWPARLATRHSRSGKRGRLQATS